MVYSLRRGSDGSGASGIMCCFYKNTNDGGFEKIASDAPIEGVCVMVASRVSTYHSSDFWLTTKVKRIIEDTRYLPDVGISPFEEWVVDEIVTDDIHDKYFKDNSIRKVVFETENGSIYEWKDM